MGGPCKSDDRLQLTDLRTKHLVLGFHLLYICSSSLFYYISYNIITHYPLYPPHFYWMLIVTSISKSKPFLKYPQNGGAPTLPTCNNSGPHRRVSSCCFLSYVPTEYPLMCKEILLAAIQIWKHPIGRINSLENQISLAALTSYQ